MTTRERLRQIVDEISDDQAERLLRQLDKSLDLCGAGGDRESEFALFFDFLNDVSKNISEINKIESQLTWRKTQNVVSTGNIDEDEF